MYRITVTRRGYVVAVYFNNDPHQGETNARMVHGGRCQYHTEPA